MNPDLESILNDAKILHVEGLNCAETVFWALTKYWDIDIPFSVATGLGGGVARSGGPCGALLGAILAIGAKVGREDPADTDSKVECLRLGQEVTETFVEVMGSGACRDILDFLLGEEGGSEKYRAGGFKEGKCQDAVVAAIVAAAGVLKQAPEEGEAEEFEAERDDELEEEPEEEE
mgnify:CR=1 FL=1